MDPIQTIKQHTDEIFYSFVVGKKIGQTTGFGEDVWITQQPPQTGQVKLNCDRARDERRELAIVGGLIRDD